jgi:hypothetical protein
MSQVVIEESSRTAIVEIKPHGADIICATIDQHDYDLKDINRKVCL